MDAGSPQMRSRTWPADGSGRAPMPWTWDWSTHWAASTMRSQGPLGSRHSRWRARAAGHVQRSARTGRRRGGARHPGGGDSPGTNRATPADHAR